MKKSLIVVALGMLTLGAFWGDSAWKGNQGVFIMNDSTIVSLPAQVHTTKYDKAQVTFSNSGANDRLIGYNHVTYSAAASVVVASGSAIRIELHGGAGVVCSDCTDASGVTVTVDTYKD